jgi:hypothetical protein
MDTEGPPTSRDLWLERLSAVLFFTQIVHLIWMTTYVIPIQLGSSPIWSPPEAPLALADYLELPAIIATSVLYIRTKNWKMLFLVNVQLFHIFWITDEFVLDRGTLVPVLAWIAILIDYLELPVIFDTIRRAVRGFTKQPAAEDG